MAFTGVAVVTKVSDRLVRITGLSLAGDASGVIGFAGEAVPAEVALPAGLEKLWEPYKNGDGDAVSLANAINVYMNVVTDVTAAVPISVVKSGTDETDFKLTFHNDSAATVSAELEILIQYH